VKSAVKFVNNYEQVAAEIALRNRYDYVICGHIHQPQMREVVGTNGNKVLYLNSGDWVENYSALEYRKGKWSVYRYDDDPLMMKELSNSNEPELMNMEDPTGLVFEKMVREFELASMARTKKTDKFRIY
jgi:predicted phosphodiesterase